MSRKAKIFLITALILAIYAVTIWFLGSVLGHGRADRWVLRGSLWMLGLVGAGTIAAYLLKRPAAPPRAGADEVAEIDAAFASLRGRLAASALGARSKLGRLPLVLFLGPEGSAKTTTVIKSGLDPELLAGEVFRGDAVTPTRSLNAWISQNTIFVEAGGRLSSDSGRWGRLIHHLLPDRLRAALSSRRQAPRLAVVCLSCDDLVRPDAADSAPAAARSIRTRLSEVSQRLGIRLPVYVMFTKADRIPHFPDYVRNFAREEVRDVFGATIPLGRIGAELVFREGLQGAGRRSCNGSSRRWRPSGSSSCRGRIRRTSRRERTSSRGRCGSSFRRPRNSSWSCAVRASSR